MEAPFGWVETWTVVINDLDDDSLRTRSFEDKADAVALVGVFADAFPFSNVGLRRRLERAPDQPFGD